MHSRAPDCRSCDRCHAAKSAREVTRFASGEIISIAFGQSTRRPKSALAEQTHDRPRKKACSSGDDCDSSIGLGGRLGSSPVAEATPTRPPRHCVISPFVPDLPHARTRDVSRRCLLSRRGLHLSASVIGGARASRRWVRLGVETDFKTASVHVRRRPRGDGADSRVRPHRLGHGRHRRHLVGRRSNRRALRRCRVYDHAVAQAGTASSRSSPR